jgi:hypothetical protein
VIDPSSAASESGTETDLVTAAAAADRCASCNSPLASDQRYCIACGERRGKPRFAYQERTEPAAPATKKRDRRPHAPAGLSLIAGVATLLLAMGVGVLIGQNSSSNSGKGATSPAAQVITVNGGGSAGAVSTTAAASTKKSKSAKSSSSSNAKVAHLNKKTTQAVNQGAASIVGTQAKLAAPTTKVGGKCTPGAAGCQNGTFTGNFFGGG